jgi:hypothetical protein
MILLAGLAVYGDIGAETLSQLAYCRQDAFCVTTVEINHNERSLAGLLA